MEYYSFDEIMRSTSLYPIIEEIVQNPLRIMTDSIFYETNYSKSDIDLGIVRFLKFDEFIEFFRNRLSSEEYWKLYLIYNENVMGLDVI
jgi:hypothetical protein